MKHIFLIALGLAFFTAGCQEPRITEKWVRQQARTYLAGRSDAGDALRENILAGKITRGMYPDEAVAAGGPFHYFIQDEYGTLSSIADIRYYFEYAQNPPPAPRMPPDLLWMQRAQPSTNLTIVLSFWNKTQYDGEDFENFKVCFDEGRVSSIEK